MKQGDLKKNMFDIHSFQIPAAENTPGYFWLLTDKLNQTVLSAQIRDMAEKGAKSLVPHPIPPGFRKSMGSRMEPEYLSDEYFESFRTIVDECERTGSKCYLYDEGGWPSGSACGLVYESDPERFAQRFLQPDGEGGYEICVRGIDPNVPKAVLPSLLMREVTDKFLELTHEKYYHYFGDQFGKVFHFAFMDEPCLSPCARGYLPWTWDLFDEFRKRKGYDVEPLIGSILLESLSPEAEQARIDYVDVVSQLFTERFMRPIRDWCREHGILSGGHFNGENDLSLSMYHVHGGNILRVLRELDLPGIDLIWRQLWYGQRLHPFPKLASSTANQSEKKRAVGELFAVYGSGLTFDQMKFIVDYMICCGINTFIFSCYPMGTDGKLARGTRPVFGSCNPLWRFMKDFHDYAARLSCLSTESKPVVDTALFYDMRSLWKARQTSNTALDQDNIAFRLLEQQTDFDYIDDDVLETAEFSNGKMKIGEAEYSVLVIPENAMMTKKAEANLSRLKSAGLRVLSSDCTNEIAQTLKMTESDWRFRVRKTDLGNGDFLYFVMNISGQTITGTFEAEENSPVARCDAEQGKLFRVPGASNGNWCYEFAPYTMTAFLVGPSAENAAEPERIPGETVVQLDDSWQMCPVLRFKVGDHDYEQTELKDSPWYGCKTGDWCPVLGEDFSGDVVYRKEFILSDISGISFLDLGNVKYAAEVTLNGISLGRRIYSPFVFSVGGALKEGTNVLEVKVTNTLANAISPERVKKLWNSYFDLPSPYEDLQRSFEKESFESGLIGPVSLKK